MICGKMKKLLLYFSLFFLPFFFSLLFSYSDSYAAEYYASANRFLYAGTNVYGTAPQWSQPVRYNEYVPISFLYGVQVNTYPTGAPTGQYVTIRGKINLSARIEIENLPAVFNTSVLRNLSVQCSWGNEYLTTVGYSVMNDVGSGYYAPNSIAWDDITFTWNGYFPNGYSNIHSGDLLSCALRDYYDNTYYKRPIIIGSNYPQTYVYADNSAFSSYLSVETSDDQDLTALSEINSSIQNQTNVILHSTDQILDSMEGVTEDLSDVKDFLTDDTPPSVDTSTALADPAGWLPAGPVDSILTLPISFMQGIVNVLTGSDNCQPISLPLPFLPNNQTLTLPCMRPILNQMGFLTIYEVVGGIVAMFIIWNTLKWLYEFVDKTLSFREDNSGLWGGL